MQVPGSIRDQAFQTLRAVQQGRLEETVQVRAFQQITSSRECTFSRMLHTETAHALHRLQSCRDAQLSAFFCFVAEINDAVERGGEQEVEQKANQVLPKIAHCMH